jgi:hypothetical protein
VAKAQTSGKLKVGSVLPNRHVMSAVSALPLLLACRVATCADSAPHECDSARVSFPQELRLSLKDLLGEPTAAYMAGWDLR